MLFHFELENLEDIEPWGNPPDLALSWFGLSAGNYHIKAGMTELLRYSDECVRAFREKARDDTLTPYVDYYVARLYEDILRMHPHVIEPVPDFLIPYIRRELAGENSWFQFCQEWLDGHIDRDADTPEVWEIFYNATNWIEERYLDTGYLSPSANIWIWADNRTVTLQWDNGGKEIDGLPAWAGERWQFSLSIAQYIHEVQSFHDRFLAAMGERVAEVQRHWARPEIRIDMAQLREEHAFRLQEIDPACFQTRAETDWEATLNAIERIEG